MNDNNILAVVLAGGKSKRFGQDKNCVKLGSIRKPKLNLNIIGGSFNRKIQTLKKYEHRIAQWHEHKR